MRTENKERLRTMAQDYRLPTYTEIPNVGLYLEQTAKYINEALAPLSGSSITTSMISNYVKSGLIGRPVKKQYDRDQIANLIFICFAKSVLSMENIRMLLLMREKSYSCRSAYDYFSRELIRSIQYVFGCGSAPEPESGAIPDEQMMLRTTIVAVAHKIYLECCFDLIRQENFPSA